MSLQTPILEAMNILSQNAIANSNSTIVIECEIIDVIDAGLNQYTVKYAGNQFDVYNNNNNVIYQKGDIVLVLVPDGNLNNTKLIIGAASPSASMYIASESSDNIILASDNLFVSIEDQELCSYHSEVKNIDLDTTSFNIIFNDYLETYRNFVLTAKIKTNLPIEQQQGGNYGIILNLPILEDAGDGTGPVKTYRAINLDVNTMQGNPYRFNEYSLQNIYFEFEEGIQYDFSENPTMTIFVQDFAQKEDDLPADIWIKDIGLKVVDVLSKEEQEGYSLTIVASEGNYFLNGKYVINKTLTPVLKINGKTKKIDGYECYWFVEDSSIKTDSVGYFYLGGLGWKCLNKKTNVQYNEEGKMTYQYVTNSYTLPVSYEDVISTLRYKCVLTKDNIVVSGSVCLKNLNAQIDIKLFSASGTSTFVKNTGYANLIARIYYQGVTDNPQSSISIDTAWQRFDKNNNFLDDNFFEFVRVNDPVFIKDKTYLETEIKFPCSLIENLNLINCSFYSLTTKNEVAVKDNLGTASLIVDVSDNFTYKLTIQNGDVLYKYDADGDSPMIADYDGPTSSKITTIQPLSYRVFKEDGTELNETEYQYCNVEWKIPKNSMIKLKTIVTKEDEEFYYIAGSGHININYTISDTYNVKKTDNSIYLTVTFGNNTLTEVANIKFLKDGESGTNGSKYAGIITYEGYGYGEINSAGKPHKLHPVLVVNTWELCDSLTGDINPWSEVKLNVSVYRDAELMNSGYNVTWSIFDSTVTNPLFNISSAGILTKKGNTWSDNTSTIVEAKITITVDPTKVKGAQEVIYAYYPIEITYLPKTEYRSGIVPNLIGGFDKVLYAADGTNPKYDNTNSFAYADNLKEINSLSYYSYDWNVGGNLEIKKKENNTCSIKPLTKFDNGNSKNYINTTMQITASGQSQANEKIDNLSSEKNNLANQINYNREVKEHILDFSENFNYNNYIGLLQNSTDLLLCRSNLIYYIEQLIDILNNLKSYCMVENIAESDFNYNNIYTNIFNTLNTEKNNLYRLGYYETLNDLNKLDIKITLNNIDNFKAKYGVAIYENLNSYIIRFNDIIEKKYWVSYDKLCAKINNEYILNNQFNNFKLLETNIINLANNNDDLNWLQTAQYGFGPEQEFINLKNQLVVIADKFFDILNSCYSFDAIKQEILNEYKNLIEKYQNDYYTRKYENKIAALQVELNEINVELADFRKIITSQISGIIKHSKPIVMVMNRYELSNINGWDGNKLYIDEYNNEYLLAPQVGAGAKENGTFTGVVMGIKQFNNNANQSIGLFGYSSGIQSFFLNSKDGSATFGKASGGQIIVQPSSNIAIIKSGNYSISAGTGMQIDFTTPEIRFGSGNFIVSREGYITAKGGGSIAGWKINDTQLYSDVTPGNGRLTLDSSGYGKIYSHNHSTLSSTSNGFYIAQDGLSIGSKTYIDNTGTLRLGTGAVANTGKHWTIGSNGNESFIGYGTTTWHEADTDGGSTNDVYLGTNGFSLGRKFSINSTGELKAYKGVIGGWNVEKSKIYSNNIQLNANGSIKHEDGKWEIKQNGEAVFQNLQASVGGKIGGWTIKSDELQGGDMHIKSEGSISGPKWSITKEGNASFENITCDSVWSFGSSNSAKWTNSGFTFGGSYGSISNGSFSFSGNGTSWGSSSAFSGGGAASYSSTVTNPFKGTCVAHIETLCANKITADYIKAKVQNIDLGSITSLTVSSGLTVGGSIQANGGMQLNGTLSLGKDGKIPILDNYATAGDLDDKVDKDTYSGTCSVKIDDKTYNGTCSITFE